MSFERLCKLYKTEKKPKDSKEIIDIKNQLLKKAQEEAEAERLKKEKRRQYEREYRAKNREKFNETRKRYYHKKLKDNPIHIAKQSKYRNDNRDKINKYHREKYKKDGIKKIRTKEYNAIYYQRNKEKIDKQMILYQKNNKEQHKKTMEKYYYRNRKEICKRNRNRYALKKMIKKMILKKNFIHLKKCLLVIKKCQL